MNNGNKKARWFAALVLAAMCVLGMGLTAFAELAATKITYAKGSAGRVTLKWRAVSGAEGYYVYYQKTDGSGKKRARIKSPTATKVVITNLENNENYAFRIAAYAGSEIAALSPSRMATPTVGSPGKVKNFMVLQVSNKRVKLRWSVNPKADGYQVFMLNKETGGYEMVRETTGTSCQISNLKNGTKYTFKVRAYLKAGGSKGCGPLSKAVSATPISYSVLRQTNQVHPYYYKAVMLTSATSGDVTIPAGASVTVTELGTTKSKVTYDGKSYRIPTASFETKELITKSSAAYSTEVAENFVNSRSFGSLTDYLIWINTYTQHVYVFQGSQNNWKCVMDTICATGTLENPTPLATSYVEHKDAVVYFASNAADRWVQGGFYGHKIAGGYIHSWLYNITNLVYFNYATEEMKVRPDYDLSTIPAGALQWNKEQYGKPTSRGCVRIPLEKAKWMFEHVPEQTRCVTY